VGGGVGHLLPLVYGGGGFFSQFVDGGCQPSWMVVGVLIAIVR